MLLALAAGTLLFRQSPIIAWAGVLCYVLSYAFSTLWTLVPANYAVLTWEGGMVAVLAMYVAFGEYAGARTRWLLAVPLVFLLHFAGADRHLLEFIVKSAIAAVILMAFMKISYNETLGKMVWAAVLVAEGWAVIEKLACPYLPQPYEASSQCGRVVGSWEPFMVTGATAIALTGIGLIWLRTRTRKN